MELPPLSATTAVVLGCRVRETGPSAALLRRLLAARNLVEKEEVPRVVMSGGKRWGECSEAEAMAAWWKSVSAPSVELLLENESLDTLENAKRSYELLAPLGVREIFLVTCDFHMRRATMLFQEQGFSVIGVPAHHTRTFWERKKLAFTEWGALRLLRRKWTRP